MSLLLDSSGAKNRKLSVLQKLISLFTNHIRQAVGSLGEMWRTRTASLMTIAALGLSLTLPATFYLLVKNTQSVADNWQNSSEISLFLKKNLSSSETEQFIVRIGLYPEIANVNYMDPLQALEEFQELSGFGDALKYLNVNPLPAVAIVTPTEKYKTAQTARELLNKLAEEREVASAKLDIEWLKRLDAVIDLFKDVVIAIALLLFVSVILIVGNTIRLAILNKKTEIEVMKLVGATESFIQQPFLYTGLWYGFFGGIVAWISISLMVIWLEASIANLAELYQQQIDLSGMGFAGFLLLTIFAMILGWSGSYISVRRHIRDIEPD